jgi:hypothetical protein
MANYNSLKNAGIAKPTGNISLGSDSSRYTDIFLSGNVNIGSTSLTSTNAVAPRGTTKGYARYTSNFTPPTSAFPIF